MRCLAPNVTPSVEYENARTEIDASISVDTAEVIGRAPVSAGNEARTNANDNR